MHLRQNVLANEAAACMMRVHNRQRRLHNRLYSNCVEDIGGLVVTIISENNSNLCFVTCG